MFYLIHLFFYIFRQFARPLRCVSKLFYPYCADKGVDVSEFLNRFIPQVKLMMGGLLEMDMGRLEFTVARVRTHAMGIVIMLVFIYQSVTKAQKKQNEVGNL